MCVPAFRTTHFSFIVPAYVKTHPDRERITKKKKNKQRTANETASPGTDRKATLSARLRGGDRWWLPPLPTTPAPCHGRGRGGAAQPPGPVKPRGSREPGAGRAGQAPRRERRPRGPGQAGPRRSSPSSSSFSSRRASRLSLRSCFSISALMRFDSFTSSLRQQAIMDSRVMVAARPGRPRPPPTPPRHRPPSSARPGARPGPAPGTPFPSYPTLPPSAAPARPRPRPRLLRPGLVPSPPPPPPSARCPRPAAPPAAPSSHSPAEPATSRRNPTRCRRKQALTDSRRRHWHSAERGGAAPGRRGGAPRPTGAQVWLAGRERGGARGRAFPERGGAAGHCGTVADRGAHRGAGRAGVRGRPARGRAGASSRPSAELAPRRPPARRGPAAWPRQAVGAARTAAQGGPAALGVAALPAPLGAHPPYGGALRRLGGASQPWPCSGEGPPQLSAPQTQPARPPSAAHGCGSPRCRGEKRRGAEAPAQRSQALAAAVSRLHPIRAEPDRDRACRLSSLDATAESSLLLPLSRRGSQSCL